MSIRQPEYLINTGRSQLWVIPNFTEDYYEHLATLPVLIEPPIIIFGKQCNQRRDISFFSDESKGYQYSGTLMPAIPLATSSLLEWLLPEMNRVLGTSFNGILLNRYRSGEKYLSAHSDDERALDKTNKMVVGLSYGPGVRKFRIRDKASKQIVLDYNQHPGTLLVMQGEFQSEFTHEIPIQKRVLGERISVTFRHHLE